MTSNQIATFPKSPTQVSPTPKLFKPLPKATISSSASNSLSPPRGTLNLYSTSSSNIKLSLAEVSDPTQTHESSKKLTAFRSWKARQKKKITASLCGQLFNKLKAMFIILYSFLFGGIKVIILFIIRALKDIFDTMFELVQSIVSKV